MRLSPIRLSGIAGLVTIALAGCAADAPADADATGQDIVAGSDATVAGLPSSFDRDRLMEDDFYVAKDWMTAAEVESFLEHTPYNGRRSWLADLSFGTEKASVATLLVEAANKHGINPLMLLARMQNEQGMVSKQFTTPPRFGLGCNQTDPGSAALDVQLECAANTLETQFQKAGDGQNAFPVGKPSQTLDKVTVRPANRATSALYAYTPWEGTKAGNGSYLVWQILQKFAVEIERTRPSSGQQHGNTQ